MSRAGLAGLVSIAAVVSAVTLAAARVPPAGLQRPRPVPAARPAPGPEAGAAASPLPPAVQKALADARPFFQDGVRRTKIAGGSLFVVHDGRVIDRQVAGLANVEKNLPVDEETIFHWASITKTFTGIAIMQLRDLGLLTLDDPIVKYIPELRQVYDPFGDIGEITLRHLMTHSAGFRAGTWPWGGGRAWHPHEPTRWEQLVAMFPYTEILFKPGSKYSYSNPGIVFIGRVIEELTGDPFEAYIDKNILTPLAMHRSYFDRTPPYLLPHRSASYWVRGGQLVPARFDADTGVTVYNGGLNAPLPDMANYLAFLMGAPEDPARQALYDRVLSRASLAEMFQPRVPIGDEGRARTAMGLLYFVEDRDGMRLVAHSGTQNAFISHFYLSLERRVAFIDVFNTAWDEDEQAGPEKTRAFDESLRDYLLANLFPLFPARRP